MNWSSARKLVWNPDRRWGPAVVLTGVGTAIATWFALNDRWLTAVSVVVLAVAIREGLYEVFVARKTRERSPHPGDDVGRATPRRKQ